MDKFELNRVLIDKVKLLVQGDTFIFILNAEKHKIKG